jgi:hypothetical protein
VKFNIQTDGGLTLGQIAEGTFEVLGNFLFIEAKEYNGARSSIAAIPKKGEFSQVLVRKPNGNPVEGEDVFLMDSSGKVLWDWDNLIQTNEEGLAKIIDDKRAKKLKIFNYTDHSLVIDFNPEFD